MRLKALPFKNIYSYDVCKNITWIQFSRNSNFLSEMSENSGKECDIWAKTAMIKSASNGHSHNVWKMYSNIECV